MHTLLSISFVVGVLCAGLFAATEGLSRGVHPALLIPAISLSGTLIVIAAQRAWPFTERWRDYGRELKVDVLHALFSTGGATTLIELALVGALVWMAGGLEAAFGQVWPAAWPLAAQVALALVVSDLGAYLVHRAAHASPFLWRIHALHHSSERLYSVNSARNHPLNVALTWLLALGPLFVLGASVEVLVCTSVFTSLHGVIQHSNIDLKLGPLNWVLAGPELHRRHHHVDAERAHSNFGSNLALWDVVFGTRALHADERNDVAGLPGVAFGSNFFGHLASPFRLDRLSEASSNAVDAAERTATRAAEAVRDAGRRVVEVTAEMGASFPSGEWPPGELRLAEATGSGHYIVRVEQDDER